MKRQSWLLPLLIFLLSLLLFMAGQGNLEFLMIDTRFGLFVHEMLENGVTPFPQLYGKLYPDYTSFATLLMALAARLTGSVDMFSAVLPSAVAGALTVMMTFLLGRRMYSTRVGLAAALLLFAAFEFVSVCRIVSLDLYPALSTVLILYLLYTADERGGRTHWRLLWVGPLLILGYLARGPIGVVIPTAASVSYYLVRRDWRSLFSVGFLGGVIAAGMLLLWAYWSRVWGGEAFFEAFLEMQFFDRMKDSQPFWYYFTNAVGSYAATYPLALAVLACYLWKNRRNWAFFRRAGNESLARIQILAAWMFIVLIGMSIPGTKHLRYIVPVLPAMAILAALLFFNPDHLRWLTRLRAIAWKIIFFLPWAAALAVIAVAVVFRIPAVAERAKADVVLPVWITLPGLALLVLALFAARKHGPGVRMLAAALALGMTVYLARVTVVEPIDQARMSSRAFVAEVEALRPAGASLTFYCLGPDGDENKYMICIDRERRFIPANIDHDEPEKLAALPPGSYLVGRLDRWEKFAPEEVRSRAEILAEGRIARRDCFFARID